MNIWRGFEPPMKERWRFCERGICLPPVQSLNSHWGGCWEIRSKADDPPAQGTEMSAALAHRRPLETQTNSAHLWSPKELCILHVWQWEGLKWRCNYERRVDTSRVISAQTTPWNERTPLVWHSPIIACNAVYPQGCFNFAYVLIKDECCLFNVNVISHLIKINIFAWI